MTSIARQVVASGASTESVAREIVEGLRAPDLRIAFVFADWRHDPAVFAKETQRGLSPAVALGGTTTGIVAASAPRDGMAAVGLGLYGDWVHVGVGIASDLPKSALTRSRRRTGSGAPPRPSRYRTSPRDHSDRRRS